MLHTMWTLLLAAALAGPLAENLRHVARSPNGMVVSCADGERAWIELARLGPLFGGAADRERWAPVFAAGVPVIAALDLDQARVEMAFPSALGAEGVARAMADDDPEATAEFTAAGWVVRRREEAYRVGVVDGWAHINLGADAPEAALRGAPAPLLAALPGEDGCLVLGRLPEGDDVRLVGDYGVHFPLGSDDPIRFAVTGAPAELASIIPLDPRPARTLRTRLRPTAVASVGVAFDRIDFRLLLRGAELARARALQRTLPLTTGALLAIIGETPGEMQAAAVLPLAPVRGAVLPAAAVARRAAGVLRGMKFPIEVLDATHFRAGLEDGDWIWLAGTPGALYLSTGQAALADMERNEGEAWAAGSFADQAGRFPLVVASHLAPDAAGEPQRLDEAISLAVGVHGGVVSGELALALTSEERLGLLGGLRVWLERLGETEEE